MALAEFAAKALVAAETLGVKKKPIQDFPLDDAERFIVAHLPDLSSAQKRKLKAKSGTFSVADIASIVLAVSESLLDGEPLQRLRLLFIARKLTDCLQASVVPAANAKPRAAKSKSAKQVYQFKITLMGIKPKVWRRNQIKECFLGDLHWHIQGAFGWTNSHLHDFDVGPDRYGIPSMIDMDKMPECRDSTKTRLRQLLPKDGKPFAFKYTYDLGDNWEHEVLFEGVVEPPKKTRLPICIEGERACPPEDCGGEGGYEHLLYVLGDPTHKEHQDLRRWVGEFFNPERFDPKMATAIMREYN